MIDRDKELDELQTFLLLKYGSFKKLHMKWCHSTEDFLTYDEKLLLLYSTEINFISLRQMEEHRGNCLYIDRLNKSNGS